MSTLRTKLLYLIDSSTKAATGRGRQCPSCGSGVATVVDRKYLVTQLRRCGGCRLMFRVPTSSPGDAARFYEKAYEQGFTTRLPAAGELERLVASRFAGTGKSFGPYIEALAALEVPAGARVLDFGCSWGYGTWQLRDAGFDVQGFEISARRCAFARDALRVDATSAWEDLRPPFDVVFTSHVLEHIAELEGALRAVWALLRPGGLLVAFTPNGCAAFRARAPHAWSRLWGYVHPNLLDDVYYQHRFGRQPLLLASDPFPLGRLAAWARGGASWTGDLSGGELLMAARKAD